MTVYIVTGGTLPEDFLYSALMAGGYDRLVAAEGGAALCLSLGFKPDIIVGDFDSAGEELVRKAELLGIPVERHPSHKDETDTELAVRLALMEKPDRIRIFGATGTRLDHVHANILLLARIAETPETAQVDAAILDPCNLIRVIQGGLRLRKGPGREYVSVYALSEKVEGLTMTGFAYPLADRLLARTDTVGTSNEITEETAEIRFTSGTLLVIRAKDAPV